MVTAPPRAARRDVELYRRRMRLVIEPVMIEVVRTRNPKPEVPNPNPNPIPNPNPNPNPS